MGVSLFIEREILGMIRLGYILLNIGIYTDMGIYYLFIIWITINKHNKDSGMYGRDVRVLIPGISRRHHRSRYCNAIFHCR